MPAGTVRRFCKTTHPHRLEIPDWEFGAEKRGIILEGELRRVGKIVSCDKGRFYGQCHSFVGDVVCQIGEGEGDSQIEADGAKPGGVVWRI